MASKAFAAAALLALAGAIVAHILRFDGAAQSAGDVAFFAALGSAVWKKCA
jgi:hypothetical protein